jgi:LCP family protein required for cell wall assembly
MAERDPPPGPSFSGRTDGPPPLEGTSYGRPPSWGPPRRRRRRWWLVLPIALLVYAALVAVTFVQPVNVAGTTLTVPIPGVSHAELFGLPDRPFTVMVVGLDIRPSQEGQPSRTDSVLLVHVDPDRNKASLLSIPRDSMMLVPAGDGSYFQDRVNTAFVYNWSAEDPNKAPAALAETIEHNLGINIDYHVIFDQRGAARVIDSADGVTVFVREEFGQADYSDDDVTVVPQFFPTGKQHLNGYQAVAYGRIRLGSSDFERISRQQQVAEGLVEQLSTAPWNASRLWDVWGAYDEAVETDMGLRQSAGLFAFLKRIGTDRIRTFSLSDATVPCASCEAALLQLQPDQTAFIISQAFDDRAAGLAAAQRLVANGVTP